jgi:hypothetical protein
VAGTEYLTIVSSSFGSLSGPGARGAPVRNMIFLLNQ